MKVVLHIEVADIPPDLGVHEGMLVTITTRYLSVINIDAVGTIVKVEYPQPPEPWETGT